MLWAAFKLLLLPVAARGWTSCMFPDVNWIKTDTADPGKCSSSRDPLCHHTSADDAVGMGLFAYTAGYTRGDQTIKTSASEVTVTDSDDDATSWDTHLTKISAEGVPMAVWRFKGDSTHEGNRYIGGTGSWRMHKTPDDVHLAIAFNFVHPTYTIPGGLVLTNPHEAKEAVGVVTKFNTNTGQAAWATMIEVTKARGSGADLPDGDSSGNIIFKGKSCIDGTTVDGETPSVCSHFIMKLASADGSEVWKTEIPAALSISGLRMASDNGGYLLGTMTGSMDIAGTTYSSSTKADGTSDKSPIVIKFTEAGTFVWAKVLGTGSGSVLDLSKDNSKLIVSGSTSRGAVVVVDGKTFGSDTSSGSFVASLSPSNGQVLWVMAAPSMRGMAVSDDNTFVAIYGSVSSSFTLTDAQGESTTLRTKGSYDIYVAKMKASDGTGVWAIDGGGDGMEYFWGFGMQGNNILVSGYGRSTAAHMGDISLTNQRHNSLTGDRAAPNTMLTFSLSSTGTLPSCLSTCTEESVTSHVPKTGCFIDNQCVEEGAFSPYDKHTCYACRPEQSKTEWSGPDTTAHCFHKNKCYKDGDMSPEGDMVTGGYYGPSRAASKCEICRPSMSTPDAPFIFDDKVVKDDMEYSMYDFVDGKCVALKTSKSDLDMALGGNALTNAMKASTVVSDINAALKLSPPAFASAKTAYEGSVLQNLAKKSWAGNAIFDKFAAYYGSATWLDDYMLSALDGTGQFAGTLSTSHGDMAEARTEAVKKAAQDQILVNAVLCTVGSAKTEAAAWDLAYAYWVGDHATMGKYAPWERANKRCKNYGTCASGVLGTAKANFQILAAIEKGRAASKTDKKNATSAAEAYLELEGAVTTVYYQAAMRYAYLMDNDLSSSHATAEHQGEGGAFWRVIAPLMHAQDPLITEELTAMYTMTNVPTGTDAYRYCLIKHLLDCFSRSVTTAVDYTPHYGPYNSDSDGLQWPLLAAEGSTGASVMCMAGIQITPLVGSKVNGMPASLEKAMQVSNEVKVATGSSGWPAKKAAYLNSGLQTLAKKSWAGSTFYDQAVSHFGSATWLDEFVLSTLDATGEFATTLAPARGEMTEARIEAFKKALQDQILVTAAISTLQLGPTVATNWRMMYAYWTGANPDSGPWGRANKRCKNYGTCGGMTSGGNGELAKANSNILLATVHATQAINNGLASSVGAHAATAEGNAMIVYYQATLRYAFKMDEDLAAKPPAATAEHQGEGGAFWRVIAAALHARAPAAADIVSGYYSMAKAPAGFHYCPTEKMLTENLPTGMTEATDFGKLEGTADTVCNFPPSPPPGKETTTVGAKSMGVSMTAAGVVSDYDDGKKAELECAMAAIANVACNKVTVSVTPGSVVLNFVIIAADDAKIKALTTTISTALASPAAATAALGVTVEAISVEDIGAVYLFPPPPPSSEDDDGLSAGAIAGIAIAGVVAFILCAGGVFLLIKNKMSTNTPKEHKPAP